MHAYSLRSLPPSPAPSSSAPPLAPSAQSAPSSSLPTLRAPSLTGRAGEGLERAGEEPLLFARYVEPHIPIIRSRVAAMTPHTRDIDDNLQEVLIHLYLNIHRYDPDVTTPTTWIYTVVTNAMNNINRPVADPPLIIPLDAPNASADDDADAADPEDDPADAAPAPSLPTLRAPSLTGRAGEGLERAGEGLERAGVGFLLSAFMINLDDTHHRLLAALNDTDRAIIILHANGWPERDIAAELLLTHSAVRLRLMRLKQRLRQSLNSQPSTLNPHPSTHNL